MIWCQLFHFNELVDIDLNLCRMGNILPLNYQTIYHIHSLVVEPKSGTSMNSLIFKLQRIQFVFLRESDPICLFGF